MSWMYAYVRVPLLPWSKPWTLICPADLLHFFSYSLFLPFMLHTCSGYLGCGLHYGRNGSPQNPFSRKGLYPWAVCSCVWLLLWNGTWHSSFETVPPSARFTSSCFLLSVWYLILQPHTCFFSSRCIKLTQLAHLNSRTVVPIITQRLNLIRFLPVAKNKTFYYCSCAETLQATKCHLHAVHLCRTHHHMISFFFFTFSVIWWCVQL